MATLLRGTVTANGTNPGDAASVVIDGSTTVVTANGLAGYTPATDDRVVCALVDQQLEILSFTHAAFLPGQDDPLQPLIQLNGIVIQTGENPSQAGTPLLDPSVVPTIGLVWHDTLNGLYYVYAGQAGTGAGQWTQITNPVTLTLVEQLPVAVLGGIASAYVNLYVDPLSKLILGTSAVVIGNESSAGPGGIASNGITKVSLTNNVATLTLSGNTTVLGVGRTVTISGLTNSFLNGTYVLIGATSTTVSYALTHANLAEVADTGSLGPAYMVGDIAIETMNVTGGTGTPPVPSTEYKVFNPAGAPAGTWADWQQITNPSTLEQAANLAASRVSNIVTYMVQAVAADISTGNLSLLASDLSQLVSDVVAFVLTQTQPLSDSMSRLQGVLDPFNPDATPVGTPNGEFFVVVDATGHANVVQAGSLADSILGASSAATLQNIMAVAGSQWTGTNTSISTLDLVTTYVKARSGNTSKVALP